MHHLILVHECEIVGNDILRCQEVLLQCYLHNFVSDDGDLFDITTYLANLDNDTVYTLGLALGLSQGKVKRMRESGTFTDDVVAAWLRREDHVERKGMPTWKTLVKALRHPRIGQNGLANDISKDQGL